MTIFVVLGVRAVMRFRRQCSLSCCILFSRYWEQSLAIFPGDRPGDVARELGEPGLHAQVELAAPVDPALEPLLDVGLHAGVAGPAPHVITRPVRPEERDDALRRLLVELQRAVVRRARDDGPPAAARMESARSGV